MNAPERGTVRLEGSLTQAMQSRQALRAAWVAMEDGFDRDEIFGLYVQLGYAIEDAGGMTDESTTDQDISHMELDE